MTVSFARTRLIGSPSHAADQAGDGAQLGLLGHAVAADELPTLRADDPVQRLALIETVDQTLERKVARHNEGDARLLRFGPERLEFLPVGLGAGCAGVLACRWPSSAPPTASSHVVVFEFHLVTLAELLFVLFLRRKGLIVGGGLTLSRTRRRTRTSSSLASSVLLVA